MSDLFIVPTPEADLLYIGPLEPAQAKARTDRTVHAYYERGLFHVDLSDCEEDCPNTVDCPKVAEWGVSTKSFEEAWRYVLAAYWGPIDEEYMGDEALLAMITS